MYVGDLKNEVLEYVNYLFDSIMNVKTRYLSIVKKHVDGYFSKVDPYVKNKYVLFPSTLNNVEDRLFFNIMLYLEDYEEIVKNEPTKYPKRNDEDYQYTNNTFIFRFTDDYNESVEGTDLYIGEENDEAHIDEWDEFKKYMIEHAHKEIYDLYKEDFKTYIYPNIKDEINGNAINKK